MQAIKEKLSDMSAMRKAKAEAREEEKAEKELAKARLEVAHEVRLAREAEAAMDLHVIKAAEKVARHETKHDDSTGNPMHDDSAVHGGVPNNPYMGADNASSLPAYGGGDAAYSGGNASDAASTMTNYSAGTGNAPGAR